MKSLTLNLKREYFEQIKSGIKTEEYRLCTPYWKKRLEGKTFDKIIIKLGYPKKSEIEKILEFLKREKLDINGYDGLVFNFLEKEYHVDKDDGEYVLKLKIGTIGIGKVLFPVASDFSYERLLDKIKMYLDGEVETKLTAEEFKKAMEEGECKKI